MKTSVDAAIRDAIARRLLVEVTYQRRVRRVEPHDYGISGRKSRLFVYQLSATPGRAGDRGWRLLDFDRIDSIVTLDESFPGGRGASHRQHHQWETLFARVKPAGE